eukprot:1159061-Pelagomonas_calceolata.AAC.8
MSRSGNEKPIGTSFLSKEAALEPGGRDQNSVLKTNWSKEREQCVQQDNRLDSKKESFFGKDNRVS